MEKTISRLSLLLIRIFRLLSDILESNMALYHPLNFLSLIFLVCSLSLSLSSFSFCFIAPFLVCTTNYNNIIIIIIIYATRVRACADRLNCVAHAEMQHVPYPIGFKGRWTIPIRNAF